MNTASVCRAVCGWAWGGLKMAGEQRYGAAFQSDPVVSEEENRNFGMIIARVEVQDGAIAGIFRRFIAQLEDDDRLGYLNLIKSLAGAFLAEQDQTAQFVASIAARGSANDMLGLDWYAQMYQDFGMHMIGAKRRASRALREDLDSLVIIAGPTIFTVLDEQRRRSEENLREARSWIPWV